MPTKRTPKTITPAIPLAPKRETFCAAIVKGAKLKEAHAIAGFKGASQAAAWQLRHAPDVDARIRWMLEERVKADTRLYQRRGKARGDLLARALSKLDDIMSTDVREVVDWRREPILNADGEVVDIAETMAVKDANAISTKAASAIKSVFLKGGQLRVEMHDTRAAAVDIVKLLNGSDAQPASTVNVTQVNVGSHDAIDAARRIAFLLQAAAHATAPAPRIIEGETVPNC